MNDEEGQPSQGLERNSMSVKKTNGTLKVKEKGHTVEEVGGWAGVQSWWPSLEATVDVPGCQWNTECSKSRGRRDLPGKESASIFNGHRIINLSWPVTLDKSLLWFPSEDQGGCLWMVPRLLSSCNVQRLLFNLLPRVSSFTHRDA